MRRCLLGLWVLYMGRNRIGNGQRINKAGAIYFCRIGFAGFFGAAGIAGKGQKAYHQKKVFHNHQRKKDCANVLM